MTTQFDHHGSQVKIGDRVKLVDRPGDDAGTVTDIYVTRVRVRWDKRHRNAKQPYTFIYPRMLAIVPSGPGDTAEECDEPCGLFLDGSQANCVGPAGHMDGSGRSRWHSPYESDWAAAPSGPGGTEHTPGDDTEALDLLRDWVAALDGPVVTPGLRMSRDSILRHVEDRARALLGHPTNTAPKEGPSSD